jgi:tripartite-type tricarboxylate transporter receptor subunit TctC
MRSRTGSWIALVLLAIACASHAQEGKDFPNRPIRLVVPFAPGGTADTISRIVADKLTVQLGKPVLLDHRIGANSVVGSGIVAQSNPDGYTMILVAAGFAVNPSLRKSLPYDSVRDFSTIGLVGTGPYLLVVHASSPATNVSEFISWIKSQPGKIPYASTGVGSPPHLSGELLRSMAGVNMIHIPYNGGGAVLPDLLAGRVPVHFSSVSTSGPHIRSGKLRAIAMTTPKRSPSMPEVPTFHESGLKGYDVSGWYGLLAPAKTPVAVINRINGEVHKMTADADAKARLFTAGIEPAPGTPAAFASLIKAEIPKWAKLMKEAGVDPE